MKDTHPIHRPNISGELIKKKKTKNKPSTIQEGSHCIHGLKIAREKYHERAGHPSWINAKAADIATPHGHVA